MKTEMTTKGILLVIEEPGHRIRSAKNETLPAGTTFTSDYHAHRRRSAGVGNKAFKIITEAGDLLYGIKP